jgi:Spy/CpxP family protein refolding chaperone
MKTHIPHNNPMNPSKRIFVTALTALALSLPASSLLAQDQDTNSSGSCQSNATGDGGKYHPHDGPHLLPPQAIEALNLTADQKQQLKNLEEEVRTKIKSILTPAQLEQLKKMHPHHPEGKGTSSADNQPSQ